MRILFPVLCLIFSSASLSSVANAQEEATRPVLRIYGPQDPMLAMREIADRFEAKNNVKMELTGGATETWKNFAIKEADVVFSGSETMMEDYTKNLGIVDEKTIETFYMRPASILVRPGNPHAIKGLKDLTKKNVKIMVVNGTGESVLWEDLIGQMKDVEMMNAFRKRIKHNAADTTAADKYWKQHEDIDVWVTLNAWGKEGPANAEVVAIEKNLVLHRSLAAAVTTTTTERELSLKFLKFLNSSQAERIFRSNGWFKKDSVKDTENTKLF